MLTTNALAQTAAAIGEPARASMLLALMDGRALTATELAAVAGVTPQTASSHIALLVSAQLLAMERQGRHRYHRLASPAVAAMVETMMVQAATSVLTSPKPVRTGPRDIAMRQARTCYDHLAGRIAVAIADAMMANNELELGAKTGTLTELGLERLRRMGIDIAVLSDNRTSNRPMCRPCLDWSERRPHIAGAIGTALLDHFVTTGWLRRSKGSRVVHVTPAGRAALEREFGFGSQFWQPVPTRSSE